MPQPSKLNPIQDTSQQAVTITRASEWWGYKFSPLLATAYATAGLLEKPLWPLAPQLLLFVLSLTVGAIYVSVLNDWTDRVDDQIAGKSNRLVNKSTLFISLILTLCLVAGLGFGLYYWQLGPLPGMLYLGSWVAYTLYSVPPFRLKIRGLAGVLADALGAHLFPQLLVVSLMQHWLGQPLSIIWWLAIGIWALTCGIRNILKHQLGDADADRNAGVGTLVNLKGERLAYQLGAWIAFPLEVIAFGTMLVLLGQLAPVAFLLLYAGVELLRARFWNIHPVILNPDQRILFDEYYSIFFPLALLLTQCIRYPTDSFILLLHVLFFGWHMLGSAHEIQRLSVTALRKVLGHTNHG